MGWTVGAIPEAISTIGVGVSMKLLEIVRTDCQSTTLNLRLEPSQQDAESPRGLARADEVGPLTPD